MELICKITDKDIGENEVSVQEYKLRKAARGIVIKEDGKIAVFFKSNKNEYKLPGGGLEGDEEPEIAFKREVLEETGCDVEILEFLGTTEECKTSNGFKQISYVFVGKVIKDYNELNLTEKEQEEGAKLCWMEPQEALKAIISCYDKLIGSKYDSLYATKFIVLRDRIILEKYLGNKNN